MDPKRKSLLKELRDYALIFIVVFGFKSTFFEPNHIPSGSMLPTMAIGDFVVVNKMAYGFRIPFSDFAMFGLNFNSIYLNDFKVPDKGDIVVFKYPNDPSISYVKRVIGLPGDEIEVFDNEVFINGEPVVTTPVDRKGLIDLYDQHFHPDTIEFHKVRVGEKEFTTAYNVGMPYHLNMEKKVVPAGHIFVMGDNRDFSSDSRVWGFVPFENIKGRAMFVWLNMVYPWSKEKFHFRPGRIGTSF